MDLPINSDEQLLALLKAAAAEVDKIAAASIEELRKADSVPGGGASEASPENTPSGEETPGEATPGASTSASPQSPPSTASAAPADSAPPGTPESPPVAEGGAPVDASLPPSSEGLPGAESGAGQGIEAQLEQEVAQLDPDSLMKLKAAVDKKIAEMGVGGPDASASAPPMGASPMPPPAASASPATPPGLPVQKNMGGMTAAPGKSPMPPAAPMVKSGAPMGSKNPDLMVKPNGGALPKSTEPKADLPTASNASMVKSEIAKLDSLHKAEIASVKGEVSALSKKMDLVISAMDKLFVPTRKAVTDVAYLGKSEADSKDISSLSKSEIDAKLKGKFHSNLSKNDKDLMMAYFLGEIKADSIKHLL